MVNSSTKKTRIIPALFFISGFAALIYQVIWQRVLFTTFGINIEAVTVIVSIFMFGLGVGALFGGWLQKRFPRHLIECFVVIEIAIGLFGLVSIPLIHFVSGLTAPDSILSLVIVAYLLLALPTMLMGATLPLLVSYLERHIENLGENIGILYALNTLGSALAALITVQFLFVVMGLQTTLILAFFCNIVTAFFAYKLQGAANHTPPVTIYSEVIENTCRPLNFTKALLLSGFIGFIALSLEIFWFRTLGFMTAGKPQVFAMIVAFFLLGIALGSLTVKTLSSRKKDLGKFMLLAMSLLAVVVYISLPAVANISAQNKASAIKLAYLMVFIKAYLTGGIFPALCQLSIKTHKDTQSVMAVSWVYFFNIIGATLGSLITGFILFDILTLPQSIALLFGLVIFLWVILWCMLSPQKFIFPIVVSIISGGAIFLHPLLYDNFYKDLQSASKGGKFIQVVENRNGIITVEKSRRSDIVYGNGAYDGKININPLHDTNKIWRAYMIAALHPKPERVLEIGLSGGAWSRVITMYTPLRELVSVEINPGYLEVIKRYPEINKAITHPKMHLHIDDGRRWLTRNPDEKFDIIVMNTTHFWRSNATNLLSREFLELCKQHLNPGGVVYYNTTGAKDNIYTAAHVFKHVVTVANFVAASDSPFNMSTYQKEKNLLEFEWENGTPVFQEARLLDKLANKPLNNIRDQILSRKDLWLITDDNMATEYKKGRFMTPALYGSIWGEQ